MLFLLKGLPPLLKLDFGLCTRVSQRFYSTLSPRSLFQTGPRFLLPNHVTSGLGDVTSGSGHVTSGCLSPRSFSPPDQRFPVPNHVTSGLEPFRCRHFRSCDFPLSPRSFWSVVSRSYDTPRPIRSQKLSANQKPGKVPYEPTLLLMWTNYATHPTSLKRAEYASDTTNVIKTYGLSCLKELLKN